MTSAAATATMAFFDKQQTMADTAYLGVDTGGTFTDFILVDGKHIALHKCLSTPAQPEQAILQGIAALGLNARVADGSLTVVHGSTVATNAALEGKGVRTAYIGNRGFADLLSIGRQTREKLYALRPAAKATPVPAELCLEADCRVDAQGQVLQQISAEQLAELRAAVDALEVDAVAINLLFSFLNDEDEKAIEAAMPDGVFCARSSSILPEYKEYERGMPTWLNAWLGPKVQSYLQRLQVALRSTPLSIMQSSGGTTDAHNAGNRAVNLLLSGPAGGLAAARQLGHNIGKKQLITFDMGGTSSDVALINGDIALTSEGRIGPYPVAVPMVDMHTIGAGGGSIASLDDGGLLKVGPESAGADPGPAAYGNGGTQATVTDANVVLGRLPANAKLGGSMSLRYDDAHRAVSALAGELGMATEEAAAGIIAIANEHMVRALRLISVQRGFDPEAFSLCCFGGAGGLHICELAEALGSREVIVPNHGGVFSALGMLLAPRERQLSRTLSQPLAALTSAALQRPLDEMLNEGQTALLAEGVTAEQIHTQLSLDLCYQGQSYTLNIPYQGDLNDCAAQFHRAHQQRYGHDLALPVQLVNLRMALRAPAAVTALPTPEPQPTEPPRYQSVAFIDTPVPCYSRPALAVGQQIDGPALITEAVATTWLAPGWRGRVDTQGHLLLHRS